MLLEHKYLKNRISVTFFSHIQYIWNRDQIICDKHARRRIYCRSFIILLSYRISLARAGWSDFQTWSAHLTPATTDFGVTMTQLVSDCDRWLNSVWRACWSPN